MPEIKIGDYIIYMEGTKWEDVGQVTHLGQGEDGGSEVSIWAYWKNDGWREKYATYYECRVISIPELILLRMEGRF